MSRKFGGKIYEYMGAYRYRPDAIIFLNALGERGYEGFVRASKSKQARLFIVYARKK